MAVNEIGSFASSEMEVALRQSILFLAGKAHLTQSDISVAYDDVHQALQSVRDSLLIKIEDFHRRVLGFQ